MADAEQAESTIEPTQQAQVIPAQATAAPVETLVISAGDANVRKSGKWVVPPQISAESTSGAITIDFTKAACAHREVAVEATTRAGEVELILPKGWAARVDPASSGVTHITNTAPADAAPGAPTVIVQGHPYLGQIVIRQHRRR